MTARILEMAGRRIFGAFLDFLDFLGGASRLLVTTVKTLFSGKFYTGLFIEQCYHVGVKSLSIVLITALSTGMVMSLQFGLGLERFGGKLYVPRVVGLSIMRELGPVLSCLMLAGRVGSGIAAEIGSMNVTQQIDAMRVLGTDPIRRIVIPRVLAMMLMAPLLTSVADIVGIYGGMYLSYVELKLHPDFYYQNALVALRTSDFVVGVGKTFIFGMLIALTGCYYGLTTTGGTQGVGQSTTRSVVTGSILVTICDFILTKLFWLFERGMYG